MKYLIFIILVLLLLSCKNQDVFEGEINYKLTFSPEDAKMDTILLKDYYGKQWSFLFKDGNYKWNMETSNALVGQIYNQGENKYYYLVKDSEVVSWKHGAQQTDSIICIKTFKSEASILGHPCEVLEIKSKLLLNNIMRTRHYYYSPDLRIKPEWLAENQDGNFNEIYSRMKAIPLKIVDDFGIFKITYEATHIIPKRLDDAVFEVKSSYFVEMK